MEASQQRRVLALLFFGVLMGALDLAIIGPALPAMQADFGMDNRQLAWLFNVYVLFQLVSTPLMAKLSDRFGRRPIYVLNLLLFAAGSLLLVISPTFGVLLAGRAIQGFGAGGIYPVAVAVIGDTFPPEKRGGALGLIGAVFGLAFLLGPVLGGIFLRFSWHWLFLINLPIAALLAWQAWRLLPAAGAAELRPFDWPGAVTLSAALTGLAVAVTNADSAALPASLGSPGVWPFILLTAAMLPLFWRLEERAADPIVRTALFRSTQIRLTVGIALGVGTVESGSVFFPALAVSALGVTEATASWLMLPSVIALTITAPIVGRLLDRFGSRLMVQSGLALVCLGVLVYALSELDLVAFIGGSVLAGVGLAALLGAPLRYIILNETRADERGAAQGLLNVFLSVGQLLGAAIVGGVAASLGGGTGGYQSAFLVLAVLTGTLVLVSLALKSRAAELASLRAH